MKVFEPPTEQRQSDERSSFVLKNQTVVISIPLLRFALYFQVVKYTNVCTKDNNM
jgi:hypothetical protein